jgi:hypothetical protein
MRSLIIGALIVLDLRLRNMGGRMNNPWRIRQQVMGSDAETLAAIKLIRARGRASQGMLAL